VAGVLLNQVEQDALEGCGWPTLPARARPSDVRQLVGLHHQAATCALRLEGVHEVSQALIAGDVPTFVPGVAPRLRDRLALEALHQPAELDIGQVLEQLQRRPSGRKPARSQLVVPQPLKLADHDRAEVVEVAEEDLRARGTRIGR